MDDLKKHLLNDRKDDVAENMLRRLLTYAIGRDLTYRDRYDVEVQLANSKQNEYRIRDMIIAICQSETFRGLPK
jgi:hypothetical protein